MRKIILIVVAAIIVIAIYAMGRHRSAPGPADMVGNPGPQVAVVAAPELVVMRVRRQPTRSVGTCPLGP